MKTFIFIVLTSFLLINISAQTIYDIQGQAESSPYVNQTVTTKGLVTAVFSGSYAIQDGDSAWCGIYVYDNVNTPALGDSVLLTALVVEYYDFTELKNITDFQVLSSDNDLPHPIVLTVGDVEEKWESMLVRVEGVLCSNTSLGYGEWEVSDGADLLPVNDLGVAYTPVLGVAYKVTGMLEYSFGSYKVNPRTVSDIEQDMPLFFRQKPNVSAITRAGFTLDWLTNDSAIGFVEYGLTSAYELGTLSSSVEGLSHSFTLDDLSAGELYYVKCYSVSSANDTTPLSETTYCTQSNSSGVVNVTFVAPFVVNTPNTIIDSLEHYIAMAKETLDIAIYDLTNHAFQSDSINYRLIRAVNKAYDRGVKIRFVTDDAVANAALDSLNENISILRGNTGGIMHNKVLVIDRLSVANAWVLSGSTNWTYNNLMMDFNNLIAIQDQSLAKAYTLEFEEMWGSAGLVPNEANSRFGADKIDNTPHLFNVNGKRVELYFSPSDNTSAHIQSALDSAKETIDFVMMTFTENSLGTAIYNAEKRGVDVTGIIDYVEQTGSDYAFLKGKGVNVIDFANADGSSWPDGITCHHKFAVVDGGTNDALVITGTHNWTASANSKHDENTLFIYNDEVAEQYLAEMALIMDYVDGALGVEALKKVDVSIAPNPSSGSFEITNYGTQFSKIEVINASGRVMKTMPLDTASTRVHVQGSGLYVVLLSGKNDFAVKKVLVR